MNKSFFFALLSLHSIILFAQESNNIIPSEKIKFVAVEKIIIYQLPGKIVPLKIQQYGDRRDIFFINLHDDEFTSVIAAKSILEQEGGLLIEVENDQKRNIRFSILGANYSFDPNRIFSREGIERTLTEQGRKSNKAVDEVEKFGRQLLELIPKEAVCVIALHNNSEGFFAATEYSAGNIRTKESLKVYLNISQDPDDFFLTTDAELYELLADKGYNCVLQDNIKCTDDGSLSVYYGRRNLRYVNCETVHGKTELYIEMIKALLTSLHNK